MKKIVSILAFTALIACSSTQYIDSWKSQEVNRLNPEKLLVVGMTDKLTVRKIFEEQLKKEFIKRGINAHESAVVLDVSFTGSQKSEEEIDAMKDKLITDGFDTVVITAIIGVDDRREYLPGQYYPMGFTWYRFGRYYYRYQSMYYDPGYYNEYRVYHIETSIYNIKEDEDKSLVWVGSFSIVDPATISTTVNDYVQRIIRQLEKEWLIDRIN